MPKHKDPNVWFQNALKVSEDPVDAAGDAEVLYRILKLRSAAVQKAVVLPGATGKSPKTTAAPRIES
jgi:hypothetical protein